nr:Metabolism_regulation [Stutzerimonas stutzeri]
MTSRTDFVIDQVMRGNSAVVHNVKLLDVTEGEDGKEQLTIELDGQPAEFGKNRTLRRPICLRASALKRRVSRASETRAKVQRHRRS